MIKKTELQPEDLGSKLSHYLISYLIWTSPFVLINLFLQLQNRNKNSYFTVSWSRLNDTMNMKSGDKWALYKPVLILQDSPGGKDHLDKSFLKLVSSFIS